MKYILRVIPIIIIIISYCLLISCNDDREIIEDTDIQLTSFSFQNENNRLLSKDYDAVITENKIEITIPSITKKLIATFHTNASRVTINGVEQASDVTLNDFSKPIKYTLISENGKIVTYILNIKWTSPIPHINISTENNYEILSKDVYVKADIKITANGWGEDYEEKTQIRGRGNTTWGLPKKPYRLKLDNDIAIFGLAEEKDWVLLANFLDPTLMLNAVAFKIGSLLNLQYTNHAIPVDLTINGKYNGSYLLTEQVERSKSRVNIDKNKGVLLELDTNYDEEFQFISNNYGLPVMIKDPDISDFNLEERDEIFNKIRDDFHQLENEIASDQFPNSNYKDYIDIESLVKFIIVYNLTHNQEINHPKSIYMYKDETGKYFMGPIWDFDWAYDYEGTGVHFGSYDRPLFKNLTSNSIGYIFFSRIFEDPEVRRLFKLTWEKFRAESMSDLLNYIDFYSAHITESQINDYQVWSKTPNYPGTDNFSVKIDRLKSWIIGRAAYTDNFVKDF